MTPARPALNRYAWHLAIRGRVSTRAFALAFALSIRMDPDGTIPRWCSPSLDTLAGDCGFGASNGRRAVIRLIGELEEKGFLRVVRAGRGRKVVHQYAALIPLTLVPDGEDPDAGDSGAGRGTGSPEPRPDPKKASTAQIGAVDVSFLSGNRAPNDTLPNLYLPNLEESQSWETGIQIDDENGRTSPRHTAQVMAQVEALLPPHEWEALAAGVGELRVRAQLGATIDRLVEDGWETELVAALTRKEFDWSETPYGGCKNVAAAAASRIFGLSHHLVRPRQDIAGLIATTLDAMETRSDPAPEWARQ